MAAISAAFSGQTAQFDSVVVTKTIHWKQGSVFGFGGDRSQTYRECHYKMSNGKIIVVFVQSDWDIPKPLQLDSKLQYGLNNGNIFFVLHGKEQTPYQHRFEMNPMQTGLFYANEILKQIKGYDASWIAGDYLHNLLSS
ncbi:uncharacterized protein [Antedon mediterranea]|uniref:uncharacterized protein n=1 Tax=Antedon mediterranea TaxID=105859 RepID=UPI003AF44C34